MYPNCIPQRPISNNLVGKDLNCSKEGEKNVKKIQSTYSRGGVPQVYLTLKREGCSICAIKRRWSNKRRLSQIAMKKVWRPKQIIS